MNDKVEKLMEYKHIGYSQTSCPNCNGTGNDPNYSETRFQNSLAYCPRCSGNGVIQVQHYEKVEEVKK
ncbi:hypothetical protein LCGC14_2310480 [marine sediment metagenome]|uniref:Uncharacterized protein n=1 Tax=marine sediment metagenome TaxID=412755 RepID=A0A0F9D8A4_9ZZZZ